MFPINFPYFIRNMLYKIFSFGRKCVHFHFQLYSNCICMPIIVSEFFQINLQFYQLSYVILILSYIYQMKIFSFIRKCLQFLFQLYASCICMPITISVFFQINLQFYQLSYVILYFIIHLLDENLQIFQKNISTFFFN